MSEMEWAIQQRRPTSKFSPCKSWQECAGSRYGTSAEAEAGIGWWQDYDRQYSLTGWEYRVVEVKRREESSLERR